MKKLTLLICLLLITANSFAQTVPYSIQGVLYVKSDLNPDANGLYYYDKPLLHLSGEYLSSSASSLKIIKVVKLPYSHADTYVLYSAEEAYTFGIVINIEGAPPEIGTLICYVNNKKVQEVDFRLGR